MTVSEMPAGSSSGPKELLFQPYGAGWDLTWQCRDSEVLLEGPAG